MFIFIDWGMVGVISSIGFGIIGIVIGIISTEGKKRADRDLENIKFNFEQIKFKRQLLMNVEIESITKLSKITSDIVSKAVHAHIFYKKINKTNKSKALKIHDEIDKLITQCIDDLQSSVAFLPRELYNNLVDYTILFSNQMLLFYKFIFDKKGDYSSKENIEIRDSYEDTRNKIFNDYRNSIFDQ